MEMTRYRTVIRFVLGAGMFFQCCHSHVNCRNDHGHEVDWYILYKLPNVNNGGLAYLYMDKSTNGWNRSRKNIDSTSGTLANTLKPLLDFYKRKMEGFGYMLYNDQPPDSNPAPASFGHSKGLQLKYIHAYPYDSDIPKTFHEELRCVAQRSCYPKRAPWFREKILTSVEGHKFHSFAKYHRFGDDLYSGLIVKGLQQDLYVKSWGKMKRPLPSNCSIPNHVYNVYKVQPPKMPPPKMPPFMDTVDHSKWCVTPDRGRTCIADMNREMSQMSRGGGAICTDDAAVGEAFYAMITKYKPCNSERKNSNTQLREL
ncbi:deoxyribonuclease-2-alpha isoform X4 [Scophthalmus maximus]|uniref:deoxyribonuclease-2-alpha isoform X4 n=1 Tax=Scophthalmus maximus TaxID=52904 RepID=UPI001FA8E35E|nr:deoxyribonuclease-2-alpha isoform X4 [Scophthalmus maximus]